MDLVYGKCCQGGDPIRLARDKTVTACRSTTRSACDIDAAGNPYKRINRGFYK